MQTAWCRWFQSVFGSIGLNQIVFRDKHVQCSMFNSCHTNLIASLSVRTCLRVCLCVPVFVTCVLSHVRDMTARRWLQMRTQERGGPEVQKHKHTGDETTWDTTYIHAGTLDIHTLLLILLHVHSSTELLGSCRATGPNVTDSEVWEWRRWSRPLLSVLMCWTENSPLHTSFKCIANASDVANGNI